MYHPIYQAGIYLAENGREECLACVAGLRQYAIAYPRLWEIADEVEKLYHTNTKSL